MNKNWHYVYYGFLVWGVLSTAVFAGESPGEHMKNRSFEKGFSNWSLFVHPSMTSQVKHQVSRGILTVQVEKRNKLAAHVQLIQAVTLKEGQRYKISFDVKREGKSVNMPVFCQQEQKPWKNQGLSKTVQQDSTDWTHHQLYFAAKNLIQNNSPTIRIYLGNQEGTVHFKNFSLIAATENKISSPYSDHRQKDVATAFASEGTNTRTINLFQLGAINDFDGTTGTDIAPYLKKANEMDISVIEITGPGWFLASSYRPRSGITLRNGGGGIINRTAKGIIAGGSRVGATTLPLKGKMEIGDRKIVTTPSIFEKLKIGSYILIKKKTTLHNLSNIGDFTEKGKQNDINYWGCQEQLLKIIEKTQSDHTITFDDQANFLYDFDGPAKAILVPDVVEGFRCEGLTFNNVGTKAFPNE